MASDTRSIKTFIWHGEQCFFVSTIDRDSSSDFGGRFAETIIWLYDWAKKERGALISQTTDSEGSIREHMRQVAAIHETGGAAP